MGKPKMPRGPKKHLKRLAAPSAWMLDKLGGKYAPHPSAGPHKLRECLPLCIFIRNRLKYALSGREVSLIVKQRLVKVDNKVRTDETYPAGFMDVISIEKSNEHFRLMYDTKGRFAIHRISAEEAEYAVQGQEGAARRPWHPLHCHARRPHDPLPRPGHQGQRLGQARLEREQDRRLPQV